MNRSCKLGLHHLWRGDNSTHNTYKKCHDCKSSRFATSNKKHAKMYSLQTKLNVSFIVRWETVVFVVGRVYSFSTSLQKS